MDILTSINNRKKNLHSNLFTVFVEVIMNAQPQVVRTFIYIHMLISQLYKL